jgi:hypothetical protein
MGGLFEPGQVGELGYGQVIDTELAKALSLGYGTDSAALTGGSALRYQDIDASVVNALAVQKRDFKLMNLLKQRKTGSSVFEYTRRNDAGQYGLIFSKEGGDARASDQTLERVTRLVKYMQTYREVTLQMLTANTLENAKASEKEAGILTVLKGAEYGCFHGNADAVPEQYDNIIKQILAVNGPNGAKNVYDVRGKNLGTDGEKAFKECARKMFDNGGNATHAFMPSILASDFQDVIKDRFRTDAGEKRGAAVVEAYPTAFSDDIIVAGDAAGADKMFFTREGVAAIGDATKRPNAPSITAAAAADSGSKFVTADAGNYTFAVHAISEDGISAASSVATLAVAAGDKVTLTITPDGTKPGTGFIITRGKKGSTTDLKEIARIGKAATATTAFIDLNEVLPGTGDVLLLSHNTIQPSSRRCSSSSTRRRAPSIRS